MSTRQRKKIIGNQLALRDHLWPGLKNEELWIRTQRKGFTTIPRSMPLIMQIMDDLSKGKPTSSTYLELWCRAYDECFITLHKQGELAFHSGFTGQRALSNWKVRLKILHDLGFIDIKSGPNGQMSYALLWNPYQVIKKLYQQKHPGITEATYNALYARVLEIGANDLD